MAENLKAKHLAEAGYLGPEARKEAHRDGTVTGRFPPGKLNFGRVTHTVHPIKHMVVTGELTTGFIFYGLFDTVEKAVQWGDHNLKSGTLYRVHTLFDVRNDA